MDCTQRRSRLAIIGAAILAVLLGAGTPSSYALRTPSGTLNCTPQWKCPTPTPVPTPTPTSIGWTTVVDDQFDGSTIPSHWTLYDNFYSSHPSTNCDSPSQEFVANGYLTLRMEWKTGICRSWNPVTFTGWWSGGMAINSQVPSSNDGRVTIRWRVVNNGIISHRIVPMRWPTGSSSAGDGEEDLCEDTSNSQCRSFIHYGGSANYQLSHLYTVDLTQWHTWRFEQKNDEIRTWIDDLATPVWACTATTSPACNSTTIMSSLKHVVLQQECAAASLACPPQSSGTEDIQVDFIIIENPS